jgi:hypothetical protein
LAYHQYHTGGKFATGVTDTPAANLPPESSILVANLPLHWYQRHQRQILLQVLLLLLIPVANNGNLIRLLKENIYLYVNSTTQRCPNKIIKNFLIEYFFPLPPVPTTPVVHCTLSCEYLEKNLKRSYWYTQGLGETDS